VPADESAYSLVHQVLGREQAEQEQVILTSLRCAGEGDLMPGITGHAPISMAP